MSGKGELDKSELREELTKAFCINSGDILPQCNECIHFNSVSEHRCDNPKIDQILAILDDYYKKDIEEAKKQERERMLREIENIISWGEYEELQDGTKIRDGHIMSEPWQALKEEK